MPFVVTNSVPDLEDSPILVLYLCTGVVIMAGVGRPEGAVFAGPGSLFVNSSGEFYKKTTSFAFNTGWQEVQAAVLAGFGAEMVVAASVASNSTSGTGLDPLTGQTVPGGSVNTDGRRINYVADGNFTGAAGNKRLVLQVNAATMFDTGLQAINNNNWHLEAQILRLTSTTGLCTVRESHTPFGATAAPGAFGTTTFIAVINWTNPVTIEMLGECANAADTVSQGSAISSIL